jgi:hypothetical protein
MSGPKRLLDEGTDLERLLIAGGRSVRPNRIAKARVGFLLFLSGMGFAPSALAAASNARVWLATKWLAVGLAAGAVAFSAARVARHEVGQEVIATSGVGPSRSSAVNDRPNLDKLPAPAPAPAPEAELPPESRLEVNADVAKKDRPPSEARPSRDGVPKGVSMEEIQEIDAARRAVEAGDPKGALQKLDRYAKNHPNGALEQEHWRLRIEALAAQGDLGAARSLLRRFLLRYPQSAHRKRLQSLLSG